MQCSATSQVAHSTFMIYHFKSVFFSSVTQLDFYPRIFISGTWNPEKFIGQEPYSFEEKDRLFYSQRDFIFFTGEALF